MRSRFTALLIALAMVAPTAAFASGLPCDEQPLIMASCCCDPPGELQARDEQVPAPASVDATCCCSIEQAPAGRQESSDGPLHESAAPKAPGAAIASLAPFANDPAPADVAIWHARGPPPARSLLSQRTSFLC